ncbi:hypothetical protein BFP72_11460 [Reichenbachiella sp. 5M10]|uniref:ankyrin repeat domain-containing protein n=1 Tax=Reichenbachiella sp. 5M10 TaxID=1889772 RepID=UPI000C160C52|nr:ankyrin repeat domain-containing protein [Reichenbachiella sp. 5M10]PIB35968.1 hypothetical protein BFP72_11460 [Reichenbachiella sp. 5M10]
MKTNILKLTQSTTLILCLIASLCSCTGQSSSGQGQTSKGDTENNTSTTTPDMDLHTAVISGNTDVVKQHIQAGSDLNIPDPFGGSSPLITAALFDQVQIATLLLDAGAKINFTNNDGSTALHTAAFFCRKDIVGLLLDRGADRSIVNKYGATPLQSISGPFEEVVGVYQMMGKQLEPMGLKIDLKYLEQTRPEVATILKG